MAQNQTEGTVDHYLALKKGCTMREPNTSYRWMAFFTKIASSFEYWGADRIQEFYDKVLFANYIDRYCGVKTTHASDFLSNDDNRRHCNHELFELVNAEKVNMIICLGRRAYWKMPSLNNNMDESCGTDRLYPDSGKTRDRVEYCNYLQTVSHDYCDIMLDKDLKVYGFQHPSSGGFSTAKIAKYLKEHGIKV